MGTDRVCVQESRRSSWNGKGGEGWGEGGVGRVGAGVKNHGGGSVGDLKRQEHADGLCGGDVWAVSTGRHV